MNTLRAGHLLLEPQVAGHAGEMFAVLSDPAIYEFEHEPPRSKDWLRRRFAMLESRRSADDSERWFNWVIRLPSGELAGYVQATVTRDLVAYIAYELASRHWRQGIGRACVSAMLDELQQSYGVSVFAAVFKARNFRSAALLRGLGFDRTPPAGTAPAACEPDELVMYRSSAQVGTR